MWIFLCGNGDGELATAFRQIQRTGIEEAPIDRRAGARSDRESERQNFRAKTDCESEPLGLEVQSGGERFGEQRFGPRRRRRLSTAAAAAAAAAAPGAREPVQGGACGADVQFEADHHEFDDNRWRERPRREGDSRNCLRQHSRGESSFFMNWIVQKKIVRTKA